MDLLETATVTATANFNVGSVDSNLYKKCAAYKKKSLSHSIIGFHGF